MQLQRPQAHRHSAPTPSTPRQPTMRTTRARGRSAHAHETSSWTIELKQTFRLAVKATQLVIVGTAAVTLCMVALIALMAWVAAQVFSVVWNVNGLVLGTGYVHVRGNVLVWCAHTIGRTAGVYRGTNTAAQWVTTTTYRSLRLALA